MRLLNKHHHSTKQPTKSSFFITKKYDEKNILNYNSLIPKPILYVKNLSKKYFGKKHPTIHNISFNVYPGEFHAFIGANGAGKTTTIKCLIGAYASWNGTILVNGIRNNKEEAKKKLGYIPENARFPEKISAIKYLQWMTMLSGLTRKQSKEFSINKLRDLRMWSLRNKSPNNFSSGQKKKILLAQALIHDPDIIVMDEPVANLDPKARNEFFNILKGLLKRDKAIFISSHVLAELDLYANSVTILDGGKIIYDGDKKTLMTKFFKHQYEISTDNNEFTKAFLKKEKIKYSWRPEDKTIVAVFSDSTKVTIFQKNLIKHNITFTKFTKVEPTLDEVYNKLVIKGSVDTQKG